MSGEASFPLSWLPIEGAAKIASVTSTDALKRFRVLRLDSCGSNVQSGIGVAPVVRVVTHRTGLSFSPPLPRILILEREAGIDLPTVTDKSDR